MGQNILYMSPKLREITAIPLPNIMELISLCLKQNYFNYENKIYKQIEGLAMGSSIAGAIASLYMLNLEEQISTLELYKYVVLWNRYVDDILDVWSSSMDNLDLFFNQINTIDPNIKFTLEIQNNNNELPFLDLNLKLNNNSKQIFIEMYKKPSSSDQVLNFNSSHPLATKLGIISSATKKILNCSDNIDNDISKLKNKMFNNDYPVKLTNEIINKKKNSFNLMGNIKKIYEIKNVVSIPYIRGITDNVPKKNIKKVKIVYKKGLSVGNILAKNYKCNTKRNTNVVYQIPCECGDFYVGETGRELETRVKEHKRCVAKADICNGIAVHVKNTGHNVDWDNIKIIDRESDVEKRKIKEALHIKKLQPLLNLNDGVLLKSNWGGILSK